MTADFLHIDWLSAAYILNPRYWYSVDDIYNREEVWEGFISVISKLAKSPEDAALAMNEFTMLY